MGHTTATDLAAHAPSLKTAVLCHLQSNCFPPVPVAMVPACVAAIERVVAGDPDARVKLPSSDGVPASLVVNRLHLHAFVEAQVGDDYA